MAGKSNSQILVADNFLSLEECTLLIGLYDRYSGETSYRDANSRPLLDYYTVRDRDTESGAKLYELSQRCRERIATHFAPPELFVESFFLACIYAGDSHVPHADNEEKADGGWVPNHTPQRAYTGLAYLNGDFSGGDLLFPDLELSIVPKRGLLVAFPSNHEFVHAVSKMLSGKRYSFPVWCTQNSKEAMPI